MCIFCKIVNGEIPSYKIYEDEHTYAFLDIADDVEGHTLVIPKKHYTNILDVPEDELACVTRTVKKVACHYVNDLKYTAVNIFNLNNEDAGQSVFHLHFHILPRTHETRMVFPEKPKLNSDMEALCNRLKLDS